MKTENYAIIGRDLQAKYEAALQESEVRAKDAAKYSGDEARKRWAVVDSLKKEAKRLYKELQNYPFVGQKVTIVYHSDKRGGIITEVKGSRFRVEELEYKHTSPYEGECEVSDKSTGNTLGWFSVRKCGVCFEVGYAAANGNVYCTLGYARTYIDPNI